MHIEKGWAVQDHAWESCIAAHYNAMEGQRRRRVAESNPNPTIPIAQAVAANCVRDWGCHCVDPVTHRCRNCGLSDVTIAFLLGQAGDR